ncbi:hypothetical protein Fcan01_16420 [Folsomia candida]|uniref:Uncharacterized protein n=1 Tax=Folsomia candida TaxID=158441 RepID=A0A226DSR4_FOLCA|nr:hypothetical protein Fcan01_16420 [Folsomia candida]
MWVKLWCEILASQEPGQSGSNHNKPSNPKRNNNPHQQNRKSCPNCASSSHTSPKDCPHKDAECFVCAKRGHFAKIVAVEEAQPQNHNNKINTAINLIETTMYHPFTLSEQVMMDKSTSRLRLPAFVTSWSSTPDARRVSSRDNSGINWVHRSSPAQHRQCASYDKKSRSRSFTAGQEVWVKTFSRNAPKWSLGVISKPVGPVSFLISVNGQIMKRHIDQVLEAHVKPRPPPSDPVDDDDFLYTPELSPGS